MDAEKRKNLRQKINDGVKAAVASALAEHRLAGRSVAVWQHGRVRVVPPEVPAYSGAMVLQDKPKSS